MWTVGGTEGEEGGREGEEEGGRRRGRGKEREGEGEGGNKGERWAIENVAGIYMYMCSFFKMVHISSHRLRIVRD